MARLRLILIAILAAFTLVSVAQVKVVDATNGNVVMLAQVINSKGNWRDSPPKTDSCPPT